MNKPQLAALRALAAGSVLAVAGVYVQFGAGWALIASALPCFALAFIIFRGLKHGG